MFAAMVTAVARPVVTSWVITIVHQVAVMVLWMKAKPVTAIVLRHAKMEMPAPLMWEPVHLLSAMWIVLILRLPRAKAMMAAVLVGAIQPPITIVPIHAAMES
jgi:hypothetical protein